MSDKTTTPSLTPRKKPLQRRATETVTTLLDATAQELLDGGYDRMSTNKIARRAGVSVGSLYQYFPNKEAIVVALKRRMADREREVIGEKLAGLRDADLPTAVRVVIDTQIAVVLSEPELYKAFLTEVPPLGKLTHSWDADRLIAEMLEDYLKHHPSSSLVPDVATAAFLVLHAVDGIINRSLLHAPSNLRDEQFKNELVRLVVGYLTPPKHPA